VECQLDLCGSGWDPKVGFCEYGFCKNREFLDQLNNYELLKEDPAPWSWLIM
jgi:hypothetical protein